MVLEVQRGGVTSLSDDAAGSVAATWLTVSRLTKPWLFPDAA